MKTTRGSGLVAFTPEESDYRANHAHLENQALAASPPRHARDDAPAVHRGARARTGFAQPRDPTQAAPAARAARRARDSNSTDTGAQ
jgi:hypothetical protein